MGEFLRDAGVFLLTQLNLELLQHRRAVRARFFMRGGIRSSTTTTHSLATRVRLGFTWTVRQHQTPRKQKFGLQTQSGEESR